MDHTRWIQEAEGELKRLSASKRRLRILYEADVKAKAITIYTVETQETSVPP